MVRRVDVRLVLLGEGLAMALLAGQPLAIADTFTRGMVTAMVAPICASMGFAALMHATGCDRHLVHALLAPVRRLPWLVVPGGIVAAYLVNAAVPSQASTAAALGPILVPLLLASGRPPAVAGAALVLGASFGGERARYRDSWERPSLMTAGEVYQVTIEPFPTSNVFARGHRIRVDLSSSNFPHFDLNPNTGEPEGAWTRTRIARNTIHLGRGRPSHILLPLIPRGRRVT